MARKKNPINDIVDTVGGWLGGRGPGTNPQVQAAMDATRAIGKVVDTATGGFGQALLSDAQRMAMTGSSTPSALYKTAAVNLGAAAAGVGAAKVAGKAASKVVESGVPARVYNKATGKVVGIHGSPIKGLQEIKPIGPTEHAWAGNPSVGIKKATSIAEDYARSDKGSGSLYVVKASKKDLAAQSVDITKSPTFGSPQSLRVTREVDVSDISKNKQIEKALKRAGFKVPKKR